MSETNSKSTTDQKQINWTKTLGTNTLILIPNTLILILQMTVASIPVVLGNLLYPTSIDCNLKVNNTICNTNTLADGLNKTLIFSIGIVLVVNLIVYIFKRHTLFIQFKVYKLQK